MTQDEFLILAGTGLAIVVLALFMDSPYAWILFFGYLLVGLPALFIYLKRKPKPEHDQSWRSASIENDAMRALRSRLQAGAELKSLQCDEFERSVAHYDQAIQAFLAVRERCSSGGDPAREKVQKLFTGIMDRLQKIDIHLRTLSTFDTTSLIKKIQSLQSKTRMSDLDRAELKMLHEKTEHRERILSDVVDALRANEQALREIIEIGGRLES